MADGRFVAVQRPAYSTAGYELVAGAAPKPRKPRGDTRPRHDACIIRPERGLSIRQLMDGVYLAKPMYERYLEMVAAAKVPAAQIARERQREEVLTQNLSGFTTSPVESRVASLPPFSREMSAMA